MKSQIITIAVIIWYFVIRFLIKKYLFNDLFGTSRDNFDKFMINWWVPIPFTLMSIAIVMLVTLGLTGGF